MNVKQLKERLKKYDDDIDVLVWTYDDFHREHLVSVDDTFCMKCSKESHYFEEDINGKLFLILTI